LSALIAMIMTEWYGLLFPICILYTLANEVSAGAMFPWMTETLPSLGVGMGLGLGWSLFGCIGLLGPLMTDEWLGPIGTMMFFTFCCVLAIFVLDYAIIETKGKQMDDVVHEYLNFRYRRFRLCPERVVG
jgi:hypothetical protein